VYLHGVDSPDPSGQELGNRSVLETVAQRLALRIALPRATRHCPNQADSLCWGWSFDDAEQRDAAATINRAAKDCFPEKRWVALGFSNGGYLLTRLLRSCSLKSLLPSASQLVTSGSAMLKGPLEPTPAALDACGALTMVVGTQDEFNFDPQQNLFNALRAKGAKVDEIRFAGGHALEAEALTRALSDSER
jgi:predicted esterase